MSEKSSSKKQSILGGAMVLVIATAIVKVIGVVYKIPLRDALGVLGSGYYDSAYSIYTAVYGISMAGLPVAISAIVSKNTALGKYRDVKQVLKITFPLFLLLGVLGTGAILLASYPYANFIVKNPNTIYSVLTIAPSIFFCCVMSTYRGYYEGLNNMYPTAISQVIETVGKLVFGLAFSYGIVMYADAQIAQTGTFLGQAIETPSDKSIVYAMSSAGAILGVTLGTALATLYTFLRHKIKKDGITKEMLINSPLASPKKDTLKDLIKIALPTAMSSLVLNITNFIDTSMIQSRLEDIVGSGYDVIMANYGESITASGTPLEEIHTFLFGAYGMTSDFRNLVPTLVMTLGVSAIPVISGALAKKDMKTVNSSVNTVFRITMLISLPAGAGFFVLSEPILGILYGGDSDISNGIAIAAPILALYGLMMAILALSSPLTNILQAIGRADVPVKALLLGCAFKIGLNYLLIGVPQINLKGAVVGTGVFYFICILCNYIVLRKETGVRLDIKSVFVKPIISSVVCGGAAYGSFRLLHQFIVFNEDSRLSGRSLCCLLAIGVAVLAYGICVLLTKTLVKDDILMLPKGEKIAKILEKYKLLG
ncbi:MAG: polysaccharide biosynthesis protein [Clostridia bacterium]|nr:polysaccharide biosynthesis protein [Clostridia bacterium]